MARKHQTRLKPSTPAPAPAPAPSYPFVPVAEGLCESGCGAPATRTFWPEREVIHEVCAPCFDRLRDDARRPRA